MPTYMLLFVGMTAQPDATDPTTQDYNAQWVDYMADLGQRGRLRSGAPLESDGRRVTREGAEPLEIELVDIGGYLLIDADSLDEAAEIAGRAPHIALGGTTLVRPCMSVGT